MAVRFGHMIWKYKRHQLVSDPKIKLGAVMLSRWCVFEASEQPSEYSDHSVGMISGVSDLKAPRLKYY